MLSRMKYINRWALMRNSYTENISEHSLEVAILSHALCVIGNKYFGKNLNCEKAALIGMFHDATEIITGDMPTPVKYLNKDINVAYKDIESRSATHLLGMLPIDLRPEYSDVFFKNPEDAYEWLLVKAADKLSAIIKCKEELKMGNLEFNNAERTLSEALDDLGLPEADYFVEHFLPAYDLTLDELNEM